MEGVKLAGKLVAVLLAAWAAGQLLARRRTVGDASSDEFELAVYLGGAERRCTATSLRRGVVRVLCGGVELDLREAALDPGGASLKLFATMGGMDVTVPDGWRVLVEDRSTLGGVDVRVPAPEELPDHAPVLRVDVSARLGGVAIRASGPSAASAEPVRSVRGFAET